MEVWRSSSLLLEKAKALRLSKIFFTQKVKDVRQKIRIFVRKKKNVGSNIRNFCCCCWLPDPFRGMGAWRKTMEPQKPGNTTGSGPEVIKRQRVAKE